MLLLSLLFFQHPNVLAEEDQGLIHPLQAGGHLGGIALADGVQAQVGGDDGVFIFDQARVDDLIQRRLGEGRGELAAQVV